MLIGGWRKTTTIEEVVDQMASCVEMHNTVVWTTFNEIHIQIGPEIPKELRKEAATKQYQREADRTEFEDAER